MEWILPDGEDEPSPPDGYVVSFVPFHERGFTTPPHRFLRRVEVRAHHEEQKRLGDLLKVIMTLKGHSLRGTGIIGAYHVRRLAPLMVHALSMYKMTLDSTPEGMVMVAGEALSVDKMAQYIKEAMECPLDPSVDLAPVYPVPGHPVMWPDMGFVELVSLLRVSFLGQPSSVLRF